VKFCPGRFAFALPEVAGHNEDVLKIALALVITKLDLYVVAQPSTTRYRRSYVFWTIQGQQQAVNNGLALLKGCLSRPSLNKPASRSLTLASPEPEEEIRIVLLFRQGWRVIKR